jgi:DMSO/TMAO reductase YedYZ molybdopterin-dependent catalytic subunit
MENNKNKNIVIRRDFLKSSIMTSIGLLIGTNIVFASNFPKGLLPIGVLDGTLPSGLIGKSDKLTILNDRPVNAETPAHLLNDDLTPNNLFFVRNNGLPPNKVDVNKWSLTFEGESVKNKKTFSIEDLKSKFKHYTYNIVLECGGNGRSEFNPPAKGNQWSTGAVGCASWTGVRLADVLNDVGIKSDAVYIGYYGEDTHLSGDPKKEPISRGVPISKAMEEESLIVWGMNGENIPMLNGFPLRLIFGGYPASCSGKWLSKIVVRNKVHDGQKMKGQAYRIPCKSVAPGAKVKDEDMCIIERMPVKSLITYPKTGATISLNDKLPIQGQAWTSSDHIESVDYSIDFGVTWYPCKVELSKNKFAWQRFSASISFPEIGYYEVWARATDSEGKTQPIILPGWNPKGYLNNACHRIAIKVQ